MDFMKVFDQTVREIKREVNLKVLKIPEIEQKVLDATDNEPWGPHGSALAEIAQATKKFSECQIIMNVLWTRLSETGKDWRYVYKALTVIEYLIANGSERAVDEIVEHTYRIASLSSFEYVEPSGKDMGINVRKKVENILAVLNDKDKIQEARAKAAKTRDKYFGLSSSGITYKSSSGIASASCCSNNYGGDKYESFGETLRSDSFGSKRKEKEHSQEGKYERDTSKSLHAMTLENQVKSSKRESNSYGSKDHDKAPSCVPKSSMDKNLFDKHDSCLSHSSSIPSNNYDDDFDDFDPRGTSIAKPTAGSSNEVDLFANFVDEPAPIASEATDAGNNEDDAPAIDLFQDAAFLSASTMESIPQNEMKANVFASQPAVVPISSSSSTMDLFDVPDPTAPLKPTETASTVAKVEPKELTSAANQTVDPFASVPLNNFEDSDLFGTSSSHADSTLSDTSDQNTKDRNQIHKSESTPEVGKKNSFQVKSGIWADSLSRGLIDLNISAPKKVNLADVGVVGDLGDGSNDRDKGAHSFYIGSAMGSGSGLNRSSFSSTSSLYADDFFSSLSSSSKQDPQSGSFK